MFDFHTHSIFSDGELIPSELIRRAVFHGYEAIAITDHVDFTNLEYVLAGLNKLGPWNDRNADIQVIIGVEISHVPPEKIEKLVRKAEDLGAELVVVHGETIVEPVERGTNKAAVSNPSVDILAHPGLISEEEAELAKENDVYLELTSRRGHCLSNGYVVRVAREVGTRLVLNTDLHSPDDFLTEERAAQILAGAGLGPSEVTKVLAENPRALLKKLGR
ncbi:MAG: histidinol phosphate phosphatase domain-containing protein [Methanophagales archaeon ANME-1-THS]|nr:MAG: histidinol phosphate phosphatase domain-containing protein [Methanophagales archaeon ANME-1-THS]